MKLIKVIIFLNLLLLFFFSSSSEILFASSNGKALTPAPPIEFQTQGLFDPKNKYLDQGRVFIKNNKNQTITISVNTESKSEVNSIGATVYLEKWNGTKWVQVGSGTTINTSKDWYFSGEVTKKAESGFYFRANVTHWISHNGVYEQGQTTTDYVLVG
ncbi:hypothetical protein [Paenibacillus pinihumi]|uniref:hypothetical protein n=1 Tax=Paenibacillus pinihumi TaxID=669462 RepID=UPI00048C64C8|nr:hypothetical protein [Paenibacillus pinihumi]